MKCLKIAVLMKLFKRNQSLKPLAKNLLDLDRTEDFISQLMPLMERYVLTRKLRDLKTFWIQQWVQTCLQIPQFNALHPMIPKVFIVQWLDLMALRLYGRNLILVISMGSKCLIPQIRIIFITLNNYKAGISLRKMPNLSYSKFTLLWGLNFLVQ